MGLATFIRENKQDIVQDWTDFAHDHILPAKYMSPAAVRDHIESLLKFIANDLDSAQTKNEQREKSKGLNIKNPGEGDSAAEKHGELRFLDGFNLPEIAAEFRALRASITRKWEPKRSRTEMDYQEILRLNEAIDQLCAESLSSYNEKVIQNKTEQSSLNALPTLNEEMRRRNLELNELNDRLKLALDTLKENDLRKDEFLAMLAHELRNPLTPIGNVLEIWRRGDPGEKVEKELQTILDREFHKIVRLVDDLLDVSRITRGVITLKKDPVDLVQLINQAVESTRHQFDDHHHKTFLLLPKEKVFVKGDALRLEQVVTNLLINAYKYTDPGGHITVALEREADTALIRVTDDGIGISPELLPRIFDIFVQAHRSLDRTQGGLGIGLTLVRRIVELHGGTVEAKSRGLKKGSEFIIQLPMISEAVVALPVIPPVEPQKASLTKRILVIEDNADASVTTKMLLELQGHTVQTAADGLSGIKAAQIFKPEVILLDIGLPDMDGYEVARHLRKLPETEKSVLITLSGYGQAEDRRKSKEAGCNYHLVKPADEAQLRAMISG
ncbi:MAG: ATP-binding protein [Micavibrio sp.]